MKLNDCQSTWIHRLFKKKDRDNPEKKKLKRKNYQFLRIYFDVSVFTVLTVFTIILWATL